MQVLQVLVIHSMGYYVGVDITESFLALGSPILDHVESILLRLYSLECYFSCILIQPLFYDLHDVGAPTHEHVYMYLLGDFEAQTSIYI